jgi:hypothetical protein
VRTCYSGESQNESCKLWWCRQVLNAVFVESLFV